MRLASACAAAIAVVASARTARAQDPPSDPPSDAPAPPPEQPSPYGGDLQTGGLAPPPPMAEAQAQTDTERQLDEAKRHEKKGRGLSWVWLDVNGGFEHADLQTFAADPLKLSAGLVPTSANGGMISAGLGVRLIFLTIGARARIGFFEPWQLFTLGGEVGVHIPLGRFEPHFEGGFGYAGLGSAGAALSGAPDAVSIRGFYARLSAGLDYYVVPAFSVGALGSFELLGLTRPGVDASTIQRLQAHNDVNATEAAALSLDGSSYGSAIAVTGVAALHF